MSLFVSFYPIFTCQLLIPNVVRSLTTTPTLRNFWMCNQVCDFSNEWGLKGHPNRQIEVKICQSLGPTWSILVLGGRARVSHLFVLPILLRACFRLSRSSLMSSSLVSSLFHSRTNRSKATVTQSCKLGAALLCSCSSKSLISLKLSYRASDTRIVEAKAFKFLDNYSTLFLKVPHSATMHSCIQAWRRSCGSYFTGCPDQEGGEAGATELYR